MSAWLEIKERGSVFGIWLLVRVATAFGRAPARVIVRLVALYYALVHGSARRASREYLERIHGRGVAFAEIYAHVLRFAQVTLDRLFLVRGRADLFEVTSNGHDYLEKLRADRRGAILLGAHLGSFEAMRMQASGAALDIHIVGYFRNAQRINRALERLSPTFHATLVSMDQENIDFIFKIREIVERGGIVAILGDRVAPGGGASRTVAVDFLGAKAELPAGPYMLAAVLRCPVYLTFGLYREPNRYELFCEPFAEEVKLPRKGGREPAIAEYAQRYAGRLEHFCRLAPDNWFNFYDFWRISRGRE